MPDISKFNFGEAFSAANGKTSISLICGFLIILSGCAGFVYSIICEYSDGLLHSVAVIGLGAGLLGIRRFTKDKDMVTVEGKEDDKKPV